MDLLVVGTLAFDTVETPFGKRDETLGGSASYLATAAAYFCKPGIVGVVGDDFPKEHLAFYESRNIDVAGVETLAGSTFRWSGRYASNLNDRETLETQLNVLASFEPKVPESYRAAPYVVLGNFDPTMQRSVLDQLDSPKLVAADTMNFWIEGAADELAKTLKRVDLLLLNDSEARLLSGEYNLLTAAKVIRKMGPRILVVKRGEHGATIFSESSVFMAPAFPIPTIQDPTGAGDAFAGGMLGFLARAGQTDDATLRQSIIMGSTLASYAVEDFSLDRFRNLERREVAERFRAFKELTHFDVPSLD